MAGLIAVVADNDGKTEYLFTPVLQQLMNMGKGVNRPFAKPVDDITSIYTAATQAM